MPAKCRLRGAYKKEPRGISLSRTNIKLVILRSTVHKRTSSTTLVSCITKVEVSNKTVKRQSSGTEKRLSRGMQERSTTLVMCANGEGVKQDHKEAVVWFRKAAEEGLAVAQFNLGTMYEIMAKVLNKTTKRRSSGTEKRPSREMQRRSTTLVSCTPKPKV